FLPHNGVVRVQIASGGFTRFSIDLSPFLSGQMSRVVLSFAGLTFDRLTRDFIRNWHRKRDEKGTSGRERHYARVKWEGG
ncbi:hypothetical protein PFISCL1PPCAC_28497, partial [Pristionchus fissidentatus]